jgi:hypothetical protein
MKGIDRLLACSGASVVALCVSAALCSAQTNQASSSQATMTSVLTTSATSAAAGKSRKAMAYDPKFAKRADMRKQYDESPHTGQYSAGSLQIDHGRMVDFVNVSAKRADLRMRVAKVGLEQAYAEWSHQTGSK